MTKVFRLLLLLSAAVLVAYGLWVEPYRLEVRQVEIVDAVAARAWGNIRLLHISDLHVSQPGRREARLLEIISEEQPDIIFVTGDLVQWSADPAPTIDFLDRLAAPLGVYVVLGDADYSCGRRHCLFCHPGFAVHALRRHPRFLQDEIIRIKLSSDKTMLVAGLSPHEDRDNLAALALPDSEQPILLLSHFSRPFTLARDERIKLCLSGDTHGGQIMMPMFLWRKFSGKSDPEHRAGLYRAGSSWLYVSRGVGVTARLPLRLGVRPEVTIISFKEEGRK